MMLIGREAPVSVASAYPPLPPGFDPEVYLSAPLWNRQPALLALTISFMASQSPPVIPSRNV